MISTVAHFARRLPNVYTATRKEGDRDILREEGLETRLGWTLQGCIYVLLYWEQFFLHVNSLQLNSHCDERFTL